jgi:hypothetical protein
MIPGEFWYETSVIVIVIFLDFHAYVEHPKRNSDAHWASIWLQTGSGLWVGLEVELDSASNLLCTSPWSSIMFLCSIRPPCSFTSFLSTIISLSSNLFLISWMEEHRNGFICWLSWRALAVVIGPSMIIGAGTSASPSASVALTSRVTEEESTPSTESPSAEDLSAEARSLSAEVASSIIMSSSPNLPI